VFGRRRHREPDEDEAREWVEAEIDRFRSTPELFLRARPDTPTHVSFESRTGRTLDGEAVVFPDRTGSSPGSLVVLVSICERKPGAVTPIAQDSLIRFPDGSLADRFPDDG
jgi:hypothetical protein